MSNNPDRRQFRRDLQTLARLSATIHPTRHPDPHRDIWAETVAATGFDPDGKGK
jgi:hypothetical protein